MVLSLTLLAGENTKIGGLALNTLKKLNGDKQMKDVWKLPAIAPWEKSCTKHPTQKPLSVLTRLILASTKPNAWILDPFTGSSTTGIAANLANRRFLVLQLVLHKPRVQRLLWKFYNQNLNI